MYRSLILSVLLICIYPAQSSVETDVQKLIQQIQDAIPEPINIPKADVVIPDNQFISGYLNLTNLIATGLKAFDLKVKFFLGTLPQSIKFNLNKLVLDTDYLLQMPLFNMDFLKLYGSGKVHLSLYDLSLGASISVNFTAPLKDLKLSLGGFQFTVTGFMDDPHISKELSEDVTRIIPSTVNTDEFATLVQNVLNGIVAGLINTTSITRDSSEEMDYDMSSGESLYITDLLSIFTIWIEDTFGNYASTPELQNNLPWQ